MKTVNVKKKNLFQPNIVKKSYLYLGIPALINIKKSIDSENFKP